ncbi:hypothetical protein ACJZ2D_000484 [Fusarium nematophilum]
MGHNAVQADAQETEATPHRQTSTESWNPLIFSLAGLLGLPVKTGVPDPTPTVRGNGLYTHFRTRLQTPGPDPHQYASNLVLGMHNLVTMGPGMRRLRAFVESAAPLPSHVTWPEEWGVGGFSSWVLEEGRSILEDTLKAFEWETPL